MVRSPRFLLARFDLIGFRSLLARRSPEETDSLEVHSREDNEEGALSVPAVVRKGMDGEDEKRRNDDASYDALPVTQLNRYLPDP